VLVHETERAIREHQPQIDVGMCGEECSCDRQHVQPAEDHGCCHKQLAMRRVVLTRRAALRFGDFLENSAAREQIGLADVRQHELARRAQQQLGIEMRLQLGNLAADGRQRHAQLAARAGETTGGRDGDEHGHRCESVHPAFQEMRECLQRIVDSFSR